MGKNHPDYAISLNNIGSLFESMGRYEEALNYLQQCLVIQEKILGKTHLDYAISLNNIGYLKRNMGRY